MATSSRPATSPHQADKKRSEMSPGRFATGSGGDEPAVRVSSKTAVRLVISV